MKKLLIVDDSRAMRKIILRALRPLGMPLEAMLQAESAEDALAQLASDPEIGVLLCDVHMPEVDGIELLRDLRKDFAPEELPVVVVTTEGANDVRERAMAEGANAYVHKPFADETILEALAPYLD